MKYKTQTKMKKTLLVLLIPFFGLNQSKEEIHKYIKNSGIQQPEIVFKQLLLETGHLKCSPCSMRFNNYFGFHNGKRFLKFDTWQKSVDFYVGWQIRKGYVKGSYYEFLKRKWGAPNMNEYINKLKQIKG